MDEVEQIKHLFQQCDDEKRREILTHLRSIYPIHPLEARLNVSAEVILEAISRASDLTIRGIRGVIAEASFEIKVLNGLTCWHKESLQGDFPYDFLITDGQGQVRIQVKMQRQEKQRPKIRSGAYVVETQRTRGGIDSRTGEKTRPYRFGEFDILAVSLHPSTNDWSLFVYTVAAWLTPRIDNPNWMQVLQSVPLSPNSNWTDDLTICISWLRSGRTKE